ncbi:Transposase IS4 [Popillia japonica]|uniref:Transposase IS4 n=1 Tax=Popillia japonica TaxID=7064 RepID=A0AAW1MGN7_POPJA
MKDNEGEIITSVEREYPRENIGSQQSERTENEQNEKNIETKTKKEKILKTKTKKDSKNDEQEEINRRWKKREVETKIPEYSEEAGPVTDIFENCQTANDFFDKFIEPIIDNIFFQTNLYAVQRNKVLNVNKEEFLAFFGINMLMGYHVLPSWRHYWSTSPDLDSHREEDEIVGAIVEGNNLEQEEDDDHDIEFIPNPYFTVEIRDKTGTVNVHFAKTLKELEQRFHQLLKSAAEVSGGGRERGRRDSEPEPESRWY